MKPASDWERAERNAMVDHMARLAYRGASREAVREEFPRATRTDIDTAFRRADRKRHPKKIGRPRTVFRRSDGAMFSGLEEAARSVGRSQQAVSRAAHLGTLCGGYRFEEVNDGR